MKRETTRKPPPSAGAKQAARRFLAQTYARNGYVRRRSRARFRDEGRSYKKGFEIRLVAYSEDELSTLTQALSHFDIAPGKPFIKGNRSVLPVYGRERCERLRQVLGLRERLIR